MGRMMAGVKLTSLAPCVPVGWPDPGGQRLTCHVCDPRDFVQVCSPWFLCHCLEAAIDFLRLQNHY